MINLKINGMDVSVEEGTTILEAAKKVNVSIPTLCHLDLGKLGLANKEANCRVCLVEQIDNGKLVPSCNTLCKNGMDIRSDTMRVVNSRRVNIELLLSNHPKDCLVCSANGECELQDLANLANIKRNRFEGERIDYDIDYSSYSIYRDPNKCILCKRCTTMCNEVQTVGTLTDVGRGFSTVVGTAYLDPMIETNCTFCGQCLSVCPTCSLQIINNIQDVYDALTDKSKTVIVQTAPAVRVALGEGFGMEAGTLVTGKMVTALKMLGFDYVFDTNFAADLTTMEEAKEFVDRFTNDENLPILTSCCPAWVKFIEHNFHDLLDIPSTCKSPHEMFGAVAKTYFADKIGVKPENLVVVSVMPCVAKKYESARPELSSKAGHSDVDIVITTRELASIIKDFSINFPELKDSEFDDPLGQSTGAGVIFGSSGGVLESAVRTAYNMITGEDLEAMEFHDLKEIKGIKEAEIDIKGKKINVAVASGLGNARKLLEDIREDRNKYQIIEIMACPGGCVDGGGQPRHHGNTERIAKRTAAIYQEDRNKELRHSYKNPSIIQIYEEFLDHPGSDKAHELLHAGFYSREHFKNVTSEK